MKLALQPNNKLLKKIPKGAEAANILVGQCDFLEKPLVVIARLSPATLLDDITEVNLPTKFIFLALGPTQSFSIHQCEELGRAAGSLFSDKVHIGPMHSYVFYISKLSVDLWHTDQNPTNMFSGLLPSSIQG